jgi:hypothetical protein
MTSKSGYRFRIERSAFVPGTHDYLDFWAVVVLFAFLLWGISFVSTPGPTTFGQNYEQDHEAAARADIPAQEWMYDSTGTHLIPAEIAPSSASAEQPWP